jgi:hypothetical protein
MYRASRWTSRPWAAAFLVAVALGVTSLLTLVPQAPAWAATSGPRFGAVINGQPVSLSTDAHPVQIYPDQTTIIHIAVQNTSSSTIHVAAVRLEGAVIGLPLFSYDTSVGLVIPPGRTKTLVFGLSVTGIGSQATGLVAGTLSLLGPNGNQLSTRSLVIKVHGSLQSLYGLFGLAVLVLTVSALALALVALARHTLPASRWLRGVRFFIPGFGVGLVLIFTFSALDIFTPGPSHWLPLLIACSVTGFAVGYLTPAPNQEILDDYDGDVLLAEIVVVDDDGPDTAPPADTVGPTGPPPGAPDSRATIAP